MAINKILTHGCIAVCFSLLLQGCAIPGFGNLTERRIPGNGEPQRHVLGYSPVTESAPLDTDVPPGAIIPITPALVRAQRLALLTTPSNEVLQMIGKAPVYTIGAGDVVGVVVYDHPELLPNAGAVISQTADPTGVSAAPGFIVSSSGEISFPYIGRVALAGLTEIEASELISRRIARYIKDPQITVRIASFRSRRAYIEGQIRLPGTQIFTDVPMTLAEGISRAGGITDAGDRSYVTLSRNGKITVIDLTLLENSGYSAGDIPLRNGDIVNVRNREDRKIFVLGEIQRPTALLMRNGRLSLIDAIGEAGGPNLLTANTGQIYVIRKSDTDQPYIFHLDAKNPTALALADRFSLEPKDVVYIDPVPLVYWNRLISLILPSANVVNLGKDITTK